MTDSIQRDRFGGSLDRRAEAAIMAKALLTKIQAISQEVSVVKTSLLPLQILLEACCANADDIPAAENVLFFAQQPKRSDVEIRWINIFVKEGLITRNPRGQISLSDMGLEKFAVSSIL